MSDKKDFGKELSAGFKAYIGNGYADYPTFKAGFEVGVAAVVAILKAERTKAFEQRYQHINRAHKSHPIDAMADMRQACERYAVECKLSEIVYDITGEE